MKFSFSDVNLEVNDFAGFGKNECENVFGDGERTVIGNMINSNVVIAAIFDINIVDTDGAGENSF